MKKYLSASTLKITLSLISLIGFIGKRVNIMGVNKLINLNRQGFNSDNIIILVCISRQISFNNYYN